MLCSPHRKYSRWGEHKIDRSSRMQINLFKKISVISKKIDAPTRKPNCSDSINFVADIKILPSLKKMWQHPENIFPELVKNLGKPRILLRFLKISDPLRKLVRLRTILPGIEKNPLDLGKFVPAKKLLPRFRRF